jgi:trans-2,3-dihydro-3-hydroxyanthranilate isomerase
VKTLRYVVIDVFTDRPLEGNPLVVFTDARGLDVPTMQALARETNLSETVFVLPAEHGGHARIRIFTPARELPFAGHPTLGAAFVLAGPMQSTEIRLEVQIGTVPVQLTREGARISFGWMTQPPARELPVEGAAAVLAALGVEAPSLPLCAYDNGLKQLFVALASAEAVAALRPDFTALARATPLTVSVFHFDGKVCTTRHFAPGAGTNEDPATGSAAGKLALILVRQGLLPLDEILCIEQGAAIGRPSTLYARIGGSLDAPSIEVGGSARIVARGQFLI